MLSGLSSYLFGSPSEEEHPAAATASAAALATEHKQPRFKTTDDEDWTIVDQASRGSSPMRLENNPMENLLIEHPSMSVYNHRGRPSSRGVDDASEESSEGSSMETTPTTSGSRQVGSRNPPRSPRVSAARAGILAASHKKSMQSAQKRKEARQVARHQLERSNKVQQYNSSSKSLRRKQHQMRINSGKNNDRKCQY